MTEIRWRVPPVFRPALRPARYVGLYGGRGSGKSHFVAGLVIVRMLEGKSVLCVREIQNSIADSVKRLLESKIAEFGVTDLFEATEKEIRCVRTGAVCIFRGMQTHTAASVKSLEGFDIAWWEEAQTASKSSLELLTPTIRKDGSQLIFTWNPVSESDPVDQLLRANRPENAIVVEANWSDNPWFPEALREDLERDRERNPDKFLHVWEGKYRALSEARIFRNWRIAELTPPERAVWHGGVDFGFANDPTAALRCCLIGDRTLYIDHEACEVGVPTDALPVFLARVPDLHRWACTADSARPETIDYLRRHGFPKMRGAIKGKGSVEDGITFLQGLDIVVHPRCVNLARELASYAYRVDKRTGEILPEPEDENNHLADALRYACERLHRKGRLLAAPLPDDDDRLRPPPDYRGRATEAASWKVI